jgi:hypothetical protein
MRRIGMTMAIVFGLLALAVPHSAAGQITHTVSGDCTVTQTLSVAKVKMGSTVFLEFLGTDSNSRETVTQSPQTFSLTREFSASENGEWWARAEIYTSNGRVVRQIYKDTLSFTVACPSP